MKLRLVRCIFAAKIPSHTIISHVTMSKKRKKTGPFVPYPNDRFIIDSYPNDGGQKPPDGLSIYRLLTGKDDATFCKRVSEALELGYALHGSPSITFNGTDVIAAQAVIWPFRAAYMECSDDDIPF